MEDVIGRVIVRYTEREALFELLGRLDPVEDFSRVSLDSQVAVLR